MKRTYQARCHCGLVRFSFDSEPITRGIRCSCSICVRKGAVMSTRYIPAADFTPPVDMSLLADYRWSDRVVNHLFCKRCGIYPFHGGPDTGYRVNLGCVDDLDVPSLEVDLIDGRSFPVGDATAPPAPAAPDFPAFVKSPENRVATSSQYTEGVEGWLWDGADGSQVVLWRCDADRVSTEHAHDFDEWVHVLSGRCEVFVGDTRTELRAGDETSIPRGTKQRMAVTGGTRTLHVFGGRRAVRG